MTPTLEIKIGDALKCLRKMPDRSVQCINTSPPYYGLRIYSHGEPREIGIEESPAAYVANMVAVFCEARRVLRDDGCLFLNLGDSYARDGGSGGCGPNAQVGSTKAKDLLGIPWQVALALRDDGWYLRGEYIWAKGISCVDEYSGSCMPESVTDRCSKSHETVFHFTKSPTYFYDNEAVKETRGVDSMLRDKRGMGTTKNIDGAPGQTPHSMTQPRDRDADRLVVTSRNMRGVWAIEDEQALARWLAINAPDVLHEFLEQRKQLGSVWALNPEGTSLSHFATMPTKLARIAIRAGSSEKGACADCGAPWTRVVQTVKVNDGTGRGKSGRADNRVNDGGNGGLSGEERNQSFTTGWQPSCECHGKLKLESVTLPARMTKQDASLWGADSNGEYNGKSTKNHPSDVQDSSALKRRIIENATKPREVRRLVYYPNIPMEAHPIRPCVVLDPFGGSGTSGQVALEEGRSAILIDLNPAYEPLMRQRCQVTPCLNLA